MNWTNQIIQMVTCPSTPCFFQKIVIEEKLVRSKFNQEIVNFHRPNGLCNSEKLFLDGFENLGVVLGLTRRMFTTFIEIRMFPDHVIAYLGRTDPVRLSRLWETSFPEIWRSPNGYFIKLVLDGLPIVTEFNWPITLVGVARKSDQPNFEMLNSVLPEP